MPTATQQLVLKEDDVFIVSDETGNIPPDSPLGLYYRDTRYLSRCNLRLNGRELELLKATNSESFLVNLHFANELIVGDDGSRVLPQTISIRRNRLVLGGLHEQIRLMNYNRTPVPVCLQLEIGADFRDMFDVRGFPRDHWGTVHPPVLDGATLHLRYSGLDGLDRCATAVFSPPPDDAEWLEATTDTADVPDEGVMIPSVDSTVPHPTIPSHPVRLTWNLTLPPDESVEIQFTFAPEDKGAPFSGLSFDQIATRLRQAHSDWRQGSTSVHSTNDAYARLLAQGAADLRILSLAVDAGYFPTAGIPWYAVPFGRDSLITALQTLMLNPALARGTLDVLAAYQGRSVDGWREEQPGKILHEMRFGEMARLKMVPHTPYYGSVDATPLFIMLFVETMRWTADEGLYTRFLPNVLAALDWIDTYGDMDGDGFVEYVARDAPNGIRNQVWKDSGDSTQFPDGTLAATPLAACEVQGYVYAAKAGLAPLLAAHGDPERATRLTAEAALLKTRFNAAFWMEEADYYAQGLDASKRPIPTITSNPGHCLWTGIADNDKAALVAQRLVAPDMASGWGVRTISRDSPSYNPMSYHNGSIWPHDNAILIAGLRRYGRRAEAIALATEFYEAGLQFQFYRLPELYCGFERRPGNGVGPAEYPVSCSPQAWAAGAPFLLTQSLLGLEPSAAGGVTTDPWLPAWLPDLTIRNLAVGARRYRLYIAVRAGTPTVECTEEAQTTNTA